MARVEFYFDFSSPWCYLAFVRVRETAMRTAATIHWRPVDASRLADRGDLDERTVAGSDVQEQRYLDKDIADWGEFCGVSIAHRPAVREPLVAALGVAQALSDTPLIARYCEAVYHARFERGIDVSSETAILSLAETAGAERAVLDERLRDPATIVALRSNEADLVERGGFAVPTMFVGASMFYGSSRMPLVELALTRAAERRFVAPGAHGQI